MFIRDGLQARAARAETALVARRAIANEEVIVSDLEGVTNSEDAIALANQIRKRRFDLLDDSEFLEIFRDQFRERIEDLDQPRTARQ